MASLDRFLDTYPIWNDSQMPDGERMGSQMCIVPDHRPDNSDELTHTQQKQNMDKNTSLGYGEHATKY